MKRTNTQADLRVETKSPYSIAEGVNSPIDAPDNKRNKTGKPPIDRTQPAIDHQLENHIKNYNPQVPVYTATDKENNMVVMQNQRDMHQYLMDNIKNLKDQTCIISGPDITPARVKINNQAKNIR